MKNSSLNWFFREATDIYSWIICKTEVFFFIFFFSVELENALTHHRGGHAGPNPCVWSSVAPAFSPTMRSTSLEREYPLNSHLHTLDMFLRAGSLFGLLQCGVPSSSMGIFLIFSSSIQHFACVSALRLVC